MGGINCHVGYRRCIQLYARMPTDLSRMCLHCLIPPLHRYKEGVIGIIFTAIIIIINQLLKKTVLQPIKRIALVAEQVSIGDMNADFGKQSKDEIGNLAEAFNRMKYSLEIAINMLNNNHKHVD